MKSSGVICFDLEHEKANISMHMARMVVILFMVSLLGEKKINKTDYYINQFNNSIVDKRFFNECQE